MSGSIVDIQSVNAEIRRGKKLECGPVPNVVAALALCSTPQTLADTHY